MAEEGEWTAYEDGQGSTYWYSSVTGESTYELPDASATAAAGENYGGGETGEWGAEAYGSDYDAEAYGSDYDGADAYLSDFDAGHDSAASGWDSGWDSDVAADASAGGQWAAEQSGDGGWAEYADDAGWPYWFNSATQESTYQNPTIAAGEAAAAGHRWDEYWDDETGQSYWYNPG